MAILVCCIFCYTLTIKPIQYLRSLQYHCFSSLNCFHLKIYFGEESGWWKYAFSEAYKFSPQITMISFFISHFVFRRQAAEFFFSKKSSIEWEIKKCNLKSKRYKNEFDLIKILKLLCTSFLSFRLLLVSFAFWQHSGFINHEHNEANKFLKKLTYSYSMHFPDHKRWIFNLHLVE